MLGSQRHHHSGYYFTHAQRYVAYEPEYASFRVFSVRYFIFRCYILCFSLFFSRAVLEMQWSDGLHEMGYPKWQLVLCLLSVYTMLYISLFKGVKSSGKVVWVTATMPYVVLTILLIRGLMLPGAMKGIMYYLQPELSKLKETQVLVCKQNITWVLSSGLWKQQLRGTSYDIRTLLFSQPS